MYTFIVAVFYGGIKFQNAKNIDSNTDPSKKMDPSFIQCAKFGPFVVALPLHKMMHIRNGSPVGSLSKSIHPDIDFLIF